jgi:ABC-type bacteriocin/lantibiotic exporter with double-glycine peptidase domain
VPENLLPVPHQKQQQEADCLAACAAMVLAYWKKPTPYNKLIQILAIEEFGAPSSNIRFLERLGVNVILSEGGLTDLEAHLQNGQPCIVFLRTKELPYWIDDTGHAVVVIGIDDSHVYLLDPAFDESPQQVSHGDFILAWLDFNDDYAVVTPR